MTHTLKPCPFCGRYANLLRAVGSPLQCVYKRRKEKNDGEVQT